MNQSDFSQALALTGATTLTIAHDILGSAFGDLLTTCNAGQPIIITQAALVTAPQADGATVISGRASFQNVADLPLVARFRLDASGQVAAELRFTLRDSNPVGQPWVFSRSYPKLPKVLSYLTGKSTVTLDELDLYDTAFVFTTTAGTDSVLGVPLVAGLNFVSRLRPSGLLGIFEHAASSNLSTLLYGQIRLPQPTDLVVPLQPLQHPWDRLGSTSPPPPAGIYLQAALDLGFQVGKLSLSKSFLRIYSPISTDWTDQNPDFKYVQGYTATLAIPSAQIEVDLGADIQIGKPQALLYGECHGISLGKLEHLLDVAGTDGLLSHMPAELRKPIDALSKLELMNVGLDLVLEEGLPVLRTVVVTVGFPSLSWKVWGNALEVDSISCRFVVFSPFSAAVPSTSATTGTKTAQSLPVSVTVIGTLQVEGVPLAISASSDDGFSVRAQTRAPANLPLDKLVKAHGPGVPVPTPLTVNYLDLTVWPGKAYAMHTELAGAPNPWTIPVGKKALTVENVSLYFAVPSSGAMSGTMSGMILFNEDITLQVQYDIPGNLLIRSMLPPIRLSQVLDRMCDRPVKLPAGLDFDLQYSSLVIQSQDNNFLFQLCTEVRGLGMLAFETRRTSDGTWGFAYGLDLAASSPAQVKGLSGLQALEKQLHLQKFLLVVSSIDQPGFQLPDSSQFNSPQLATKKVALPAASGGVSAGVNIFAEWALDSSDKQHKLLKSLLGLKDTLQVTIQVSEDPAANSRLYFADSGKLHGHPFAYKMGVQLTRGVPSVFLTGSVTVQIQKQPQTFDLTTLFVPSGAFLSANMRSSTAVDCGPFKLANLGLEIGVDWGGIPSLGVTGTLDVKAFESSIAVFFDSADPTKSLVAGAVSDLTLKDVMDTLVHASGHSAIEDVFRSIAIKGTHSFTVPASLADDLNALRLDKVAAAFQSGGQVQIPASSAQLLLSVNKPGEVWHLTDLTKMRHYEIKKSGQTLTVSLEAQFYFAPQATAIGTINFPQGFFLNAAVEILGYRAEATIDIAGNKGLSVDASMDKILIGPSGLFSITSADGKSGPVLSISTMANASNPVPEYRVPHLYISGAVSLLGISDKVLISASGKELTMALKGALAPGVTFDLDVTAGPHGLSVDGDVKAGIGSIDLGALGHVKLDSDIEGSLGIRLSGQQLAVDVEASAELLGEKKEISRFSLGTSPDALAKLAKTLESKLEALLRDEFKDAGKWANAMKKGVISGVDDSAKVLQNVYGKSEKDAKAAADDIKKGASSAAKAVSSTASQFGKKLKKLF